MSKKQEECKPYLEDFNEIYEISKDTIIFDSLKYVLDNYGDFIKSIYSKRKSKEGYDYNDFNDYEKKIFNFVRGVFPEKLTEIVGESFICNGSEGQFNNIPSVPWVSVNLKNTNQKGFYVCYLFKSDMSGVYLTLMLAVGQYNKRKPVIEAKKNYFQELFNYIYDKKCKKGEIPFDDNINLLCSDNLENCIWPECYEKGTIFCKYYDLNDDFNGEGSNLNENKLTEDLQYFLELYKFAEKFKIFEKINDKSYSFDFEKLGFDFITSMKNISNFYKMDNDVLDNELNNINNNWKEFSSLIPSQRDKYKYKNDLTSENDCLYFKLGYNRVLKDFNNGFYIFLKFDMKNGCISFGLSQGFDSFGLNFNQNCLEYIFNNLNENYKNKSNINFTLKENCIIINSISIDNFTQVELIDSFNDLISFYEEMIPTYICFIFNNFILNEHASVEKHITNFESNNDLDPKSIYEELKKDLIIDDEIIYRICAALNSGKHLILNGAPGTGKTEIVKFISEKAIGSFSDGFVLTTATSNWSTFDTIGGWMPDKDNSGALTFHEGKFLESIRCNKWLVIDEINRADIDKAFGQLFTILSGNVTKIELPYINKNGEPIVIKRWDKSYSGCSSDRSIYYIGDNWRIIGTMNNDDKDNLFELSYAFMRRFTFIEVDVLSADDLKILLCQWFDNFKLKGEYVTKLIKIYETISLKKDLGPALFKDIVDYIKSRSKLGGKCNEVLNESIESFILPQLEGLPKVGKLIENLNDLEFDEDDYEFQLDDSVKNKLERLELRSSLVDHDKF